MIRASPVPETPQHRSHSAQPDTWPPRIAAWARSARTAGKSGYVIMAGSARAGLMFLSVLGGRVAECRPVE